MLTLVLLCLTGAWANLSHLPGSDMRLARADGTALASPNAPSYLPDNEQEVFSNASGVEPTVLIVNYCTGHFSGMGAVVEVLVDGSFRILTRFNWPREVATGCGVQLQPEWTKSANGRSVIFQFNWGYSIEVNRAGIVRERAAPEAPRLFSGFISYVDDPSSASYPRFLGISPHVTMGGFCDNGCFGLGEQNLVANTHNYIAALPYRAAMNVAAHYAERNRNYYFQGSYPLVGDVHCAQSHTELCIVKVDANNGQIVSTAGPLGATMYHYDTKVGQSDERLVTAFAFGWREQCGDYRYGFAEVNLDTAQSRFLACLEAGVVVRMNPATSDFNPSQTLLSQGNGNAYTRFQVLVAEVQTGRVLLRSNMDDLRDALGVSPDMPFIGTWFVGYL